MADAPLITFQLVGTSPLRFSHDSIVDVLKAPVIDRCCVPESSDPRLQVLKAATLAFRSLKQRPPHAQNETLERISVGAAAH
ncbi:hypothetical protein EYF80_011879 [Liparis tanakae]|uniref:Uncharacterized protein n=1 Tax=Liparis tanakae TaxID=230148 RepID=A0A4Z2IKR3_9TELE|nr:hypothetical protein EYF80_011879 [Liparis tanakae]